jgi:hypothetical protein
MDPDPAIFVLDLQDANKKLFFLIIFLKVPVHLHHFATIKRDKKGHKTGGIGVFLTIFA